MADREQPYDPYISGQGSGAGASQGDNSRTKEIQDRIGDAVDQMKQNIKDMDQRGDRLDVLNNKTENLNRQANDFRRGANGLRKRMWWKDMRMRMCLIAGIIILLVIIIVPSVIAAKH